MGNLEGGSKKSSLEPTAPCRCILSQTALPSLIRAPGQKQETHARAALDWFFIPCVDGLFPRLLMTRWHFRRPSFADASAPTRKKAANGRARRHPLASTRRPHALACVRDEDVLRSVHVRARHAGVLRGRRADVRVLRREVRRSEASARGKKKRRWMAPAKSPRLGRRGAGAPASTLDPGRGAPRRARRASGRRPRDVRRSVADPRPPPLPRRTLLSVLTQHSHRQPGRRQTRARRAQAARGEAHVRHLPGARALERPAYRILDPPAELLALARRPERPRARARAPFAGASGRATPAGAFSALRRLSI